MVRQMKRFRQHGNVSTYDHCNEVAKLSYRLNDRLKLRADVKTLLYGAMLHDFYLYDWHRKDDGSHRWHGFHHAERAAKNAEEHFHAGEKVLSVIRTHMWPLNLTHPPRSKEAWIVCLADKCVAFRETLFRRK